MKKHYHISPQMQQALDDYELHIACDLDVPEKDGKYDLKNAKSVFWISTPDDRSVGIFPHACSPEFHTLVELEAWWDRVEPEIMALEDANTYNIIDNKQYNEKWDELLKRERR